MKKKSELAKLYLLHAVAEVSSVLDADELQEAMNLFLDALLDVTETPELREKLQAMSRPIAHLPQ